MTRWLIGILIGVGSPPAIALSAQTTEETVPTYAQTASNIVSAIYSGDDLAQQEDMFVLREAEYNELAKLAGCDATIQRAIPAPVVVVDWNCGEGTGEPGLQRSVAMMFDEEGVVTRFSINSPIATFKPTHTSLNIDKMALPRTFAASVGKAIRAGEDPTLGGLIAISAFDQKRLSEFQGGKFYVSNLRTRPTFSDIASVQRLRLSGRTQENGYQWVYLYFNAEDRPLGLTFAPSVNPTYAPASLEDDDSGIAPFNIWERRNELRITNLLRDFNPKR